MIELGIVPAQVAGLQPADADRLQKLIDTFNSHYEANAKKDKYYEGNIPLAECNLGIALPKSFSGLEIGCAWGTKTVDVLAARSMFDGFVGADGEEIPELSEICEGNSLIFEYQRGTRDELKYGCTFATLSKDPESRGGVKIRYHSPLTAAARWSGDKGRIDYGMAIIDGRPDNVTQVWAPHLINLYTDEAVIVLRKAEYGWTAEYYYHKMGRPLMEAVIYNATSSKPFGRSRIKGPIRHLIQGYVRTVANATIGLEFSTTPQKYLLGVTDAQYEAVISNKFKQYIGNILASTVNPDTGEKPTFGQLAQGTISPHIEMMRLLATQFAAATGLTVTDTGVINTANPSSSDAMIAQEKTLVMMAEQLNTGNGVALSTIARMALAIRLDVALDELPDTYKGVIPHFKNPAMPSVSITADAAMKIASARPTFAQTDVFLEMVGLDRADIKRIRAEETRARGTEVLASIMAGETLAEPAGPEA